MSAHRGCPLWPGWREWQIQAWYVHINAIRSQLGHLLVVRRSKRSSLSVCLAYTAFLFSGRPCEFGPPSCLIGLTGCTVRTSSFFSGEPCGVVPPSCPIGPAGCIQYSARSSITLCARNVCDPVGWGIEGCIVRLGGQNQ